MKSDQSCSFCVSKHRITVRSPEMIYTSSATRSSRRPWVRASLQPQPSSLHPSFRAGGVLALGGLWYAPKALSGPPPFQFTAAAPARDYTGLLAIADRQES